MNCSTQGVLLSSGWLQFLLLRENQGIFYKEDDGSVPILEWLDSLQCPDPTDAAK
jgi:hypothetical protein